MPVSAGDRLGPYEIIEPIGKGGMGEVYRARDTRLDRDVAIKVLPAALAQHPDRLARFEREAKVLAALNHPYIATIYGLQERAIVMELVPGPTLAERIAAGAIPLEESLQIAAQTAEALEAAHEKGVTHRDLKPANIKAPPDGAVKVLDFGLATALQPADSPAGGEDSPTLTIGATEAGVILGTAAYMSPEQASGKRVDKRADIWSFGVVLWEMLTGKRLFEGGETISHTLADVLRAPIDFARLPADTPAPITELLRRCLDRNVKTRLRDIGEARVAIAQYLSNPTPPAVSSPALPPPAPLLSGLRWVPWAATAIAAAAALTLGVIHFRETPPEGQLLNATLLPPDGTSYVLNNITGPPSISPDGRRVVFAARSADGKQQLWIRPLDSPSAQPLPGTERAGWPFWSPDSRYVGFFSSDNKVKKIDISGGPPVTLADANEQRIGGAGWSPAGVIQFSNIQRRPMARVSAAGGTPSPVAVLNGNERGNAVLPRFLPDGRHFLYQFSPAGEPSIRVGSLDEPGQPGKVVVQNAAAGAYSQGHLLYLRERTLMAQAFDLARLATIGEAVPVAERVSLYGPTAGNFTVSNNGVLIYQQEGGAGQHRIVWMDRGGKELGAPGDAGVDLAEISLSPDQKTLALSTRGSNADLWMFDIARGIKTRFTDDPASDSDAVWSPDGKSVVWVSQRKGARDLFRKASDGSGTDELLYADSFDKVPKSWSPDGRFILFERTGGAPGAHLWVLPLTPEQAGGQLKPRAFLESQFEERTGMFSPDGKWVVYSSNESGEYEIYATPFPGPGARRRISSGGGVKPRWSRNGKEVFYLTPDGDLTAAEVAYRNGALEVGRVQTLFGGVCATICGNLYDVSADGQKFIVANRGSVSSPPLTVIQNWPALLKK